MSCINLSESEVIKNAVEACVNAFGKGLVKGINLANMFNPKLEEIYDV